MVIRLPRKTWVDVQARRRGLVIRWGRHLGSMEGLMPAQTLYERIAADAQMWTSAWQSGWEAATEAQRDPD